ncbi:alpha/beta fold hydrolase BchO [Sandaracinobacteroides sp. A072]|uniref:alpha/beta fold hydrolase BchO n=1 Tax=Sandaracinobacteroides sp. A072 TaxID=3461146 RepID=UPI0040422A46
MSAGLVWERDGRNWPQRHASRFVEAGGIRWHVQMEGAGPLLLLLHGTGAATHSWRHLWPLLGRHFTLLAPDLPGQGFSSPGQDMSMQGIARAVAGLLDALGLRPDAVVGHSAGAAIGARLALDDHAVPGLIVGLGAALQPFAGPMSLFGPAAARLFSLNPFASHMMSMSAALAGDMRGLIAQATGSSIDAEGARHYGRLMRAHPHMASVLGMMADWDLDRLDRDLPRLGMPVLLLHGARDRAVPPHHADAAAARIPLGRAMQLGGLGHLPHEEAPAVIAGKIIGAAHEASLLPQQKRAAG